MKRIKWFFTSKAARHITLLALFFSLVAAPVPAYAACDSPSLFFLDSWSSALPCKNGNVHIDNITDFLSLGFWALDSILKLVAYIAAGFIIYGGVKYMMAQGDSGGVAEAKTTVMNAVIGLVVAIISVALVQFIQRAF